MSAVRRPATRGPAEPAVHRRHRDDEEFYENSPFPTPYMELRKNGKWRVYHANPYHGIKMQRTYEKDFDDEDSSTVFKPIGRR